MPIPDGLARGKGVPRVMGYIDGVGLTLGGGGGGETGKYTVENIVEEMMTQVKIIFSFDYSDR